MAGKEDASVAQFPAKIGELGVDTLLAGRLRRDGRAVRRHRHRDRDRRERRRLRIAADHRLAESGTAPGLGGPFPTDRDEEVSAHVTTTKTGQAIDGLKDLLLRGEVRPGERLPPEADLAARLGRLAQRAARGGTRPVHAGVLRTRQGDGTYVAIARARASMLDGVALYSSLATGSRLAQVLDARRIIEPELTALAAVRIEADDVATLYAYIDVMAAATAETFPIETDVQFHRLIARASGNDLLARLLDALTPITVRPRQWRAIVDSGSLDGQIHQHRAIADAIRAHDPDAARAAALLHVSDVVALLPRAPGGARRLRRRAREPTE